MADVRHLGKSKNGHNSDGLNDANKICHDDGNWTSEPDLQLKFPTFKNPRWRTDAKLKNPQTAISLQQFDLTNRHKI